MKVTFLILPTIFAALIFAAHCLHADGCLFVPLCLAFPLLLIAWKPWAIRLVQVCLLMETFEFARTTFFLAGERIANHEPWIRLVVIMSSVTLFTIVAALLLQLLPPLRRKSSPAPVATPA